jgi:hypothetical protein
VGGVRENISSERLIEIFGEVALVESCYVSFECEKVGSRFLGSNCIYFFEDEL